ncbi:MAG: CinA family protein, partial [Candidatus Omnitrophica bacterium]|nr:CinA family protein [Candidatus Omnitrophota bacterium]
KKEGSVSEKITRLLASSIRKLAGVDIGVGLTGIAGPTGQTKKNPKGTVFIAIQTKHRDLCWRFLFKGNRDTIRKKASFKALELIKEILD